MDKMHILFVCTGNTCRSPMAEAIARQLITQAEVNAEVHSAGMSVYLSGAASQHAMTVMEAEGLDITAHHSQQITEMLATKATIILTMTNQHKKAVQTLFPHINEKVHTLHEYADMDGDVSDPFGLDVEAYRQCAAQIRELVRQCVEKIMHNRISKP